MPIITLNPATGKIIKEFPSHTSEEVKGFIDQSHNTFLEWRTTGFSERKILMNRVSDILIRDKQKYGSILTLEMGKTITQAIAEVEKCAWVCKYYADNSEEILREEIIKSDASESYVRFDPLGAILAVMPWNFPFWQVFRFAAPAIMAGNTALLKHASNVPLSALAIEEIFSEAGFPSHVFKTLLIGSELVDDVISNSKIKAVTLTGSEPAGKHVAQLCGSNLKKTVLELGGSDPFILLNDANIDDAVNAAVTARLINNGQSCIAAKRFIVVDSVFDEFKYKFVKRMKSIVVGDPMNSGSELGPIAREDLLYELETQVNKSVELGAEILCGGKIIQREGFYFEPTILSNVKKGMPAYDDEIFGPVASLIHADEEEDAIKIANDTIFGLGASLWTGDISKAKVIAGKIESGSVFINGMVKSDPRLPFGGIKNSGYGRELSSYGIKEFLNIKTVWIK